MGNIDDIAARAPGTTVSFRPSAPRATAPSPSTSRTGRLAEALRMEWVRRFVDRHVLLDAETLGLLASIGSLATTIAWVLNR